MSTVFSTIFIFSKLVHFYFNSFSLPCNILLYDPFLFCCKKTPVSVKMPAASSRTPEFSVPIAFSLLYFICL